MAIYTFAGPKDRQNGVTELRVAAGTVHLGDSIDFTVPEYNAFQGDHDLRAGTVVVQAPVSAWKLPALAKLNTKTNMFK